MNIQSFEIILYVKDQAASSSFYEKFLRKKPALNVPGMTEFMLTENVKLGLMPNNNIAKILGTNTRHPNEGDGIPRCELYLYVKDLQGVYDNAVATGAKLVSKIEDRNWGDRVCYFADPDGHIIALAQKIAGEPTIEM